ncbi:hypothetical protein N0V88_005185 [Collariella sp. IMI 366227]|nr:hypothetical protein N0V88_005185 [Collariella sp. IMI 366227]
MASAQDSKVDIILNGSGDWVGWNREFTTKMKALHLLEYFNGRRELLEEPPMQFDSMRALRDLRDKRLKAAREGKQLDYLVLSDETDEATGAATTPSDNDTADESTESTNTAPTGAPAPVPATTNIKKAIKEVEDHFKTFGTTIVNDLVRNHEYKRVEWRAQDGRLLKAQTFLTTTVSPALRNAHFSENADMRQWYNNLKSVAQQPFEIEEGIRTRLRAHLEVLKAPKHKAINRTDFDRWLTKWETLMDEATLQGLAETTSIGLWFEDFIRAISNPLPQFAALFRIQARRQGTNLSFREVTTDVRQATQSLLELTSGRISKGTFPAFGQDTQDRETGEESTRINPHGIKRKNSSAAGTKPKCRACDQIHRTERCYYLRPELAPENWEPRDHLRERVEETLKQDSTLKIETSRIRLKKSKPNLKKGGSGNQKEDEADDQSN